MGIQEVLKTVRDKYGEGSVVDLENFSLECEVIPTGIFTFDHALGVGGFPLGRIIELYGAESSGKSSVLLKVCANCQHVLNRPVLYLDFEYAFDKKYAEVIGVDLSADKFILAQPFSLEEGVKIMEAFLSENSVGLIVVDSLAAMTPEAELFDAKGKEREFGDKVPMAAQGKAMAEALRIITKSVSKSNCCLCFINQVRVDLRAAQMGIVKNTTPGSRTLRFYASLRIEFRKVGSIPGKILDSTTGKYINGSVGVTVEAKIVKNKVASPFKHCQFALMEGKGVDRVATNVHLALKRKVIEQSGAWYTLPIIGGNEMPRKQGLISVIDFFRENPEFLDKMEGYMKKGLEEVNTENKNEGHS